MLEDIVSVLAGVGLAGIVCQWIAWRVKLPAILFLLLAGIVAGPVSGWLKPDQTFGQLLFPFISLSVAVILFEGSLTLKFSDIKGLQTVVRHLVTTGLLTTWGITTLATHWLLNFSWKLSLLFGAITVVTGPTVIVPLLRTVRPTPKVGNILRWEGIVIDPLGALLGVIVFQFIISEADSGAWGQTLLIFLRSLVFSLFIGSIGGYGFGLIIRTHSLPEYLHNYAALALVFGAFALSNAIQHESGLLAVTVMGIWLANMKRVPTEDILNFKESLSILLISGLFIILASRINFINFMDIGWQAVGVFLIIQFVAQPVKAFLATWGTSLTPGERFLIAWIGPRGIVAAAVAAVFSVRLQEYGFQAAKGGDLLSQGILTTREYVQVELLVPLTFMVIIGTVVLQSATTRFIALRLGVAEPEAAGFLIVGANTFAREIAKALRGCGFDVLLADTNLGHIRAARMDGLETYYGNIVSDHADQHLELIGIGGLLALSEYPEINQLASQRYRREFGRDSIYSVQTENQTSAGVKFRFALSPEARLLFGPDTDIHTLLEMIKDGAKIHKTRLSNHHTFKNYLAMHHQRVVPLFTVSPKGAIDFFESDREISPRTGWLVVSLVKPGPAPTDQLAP